MAIEMSESKKARVIKANHMLQAKVGSGPLDERVVERCQEVMDSNEVDFGPLADEYLKKFSKAISEVNVGDKDIRQSIQDMTEPVMELKANAAIFRYTLVGNLANVMLSFLEAVTVLDQDVMQIVDAHHKTLSAIIAKKLQGDGGAYGKQLEDELKGACKRYFSKKDRA